MIRRDGSGCHYKVAPSSCFGLSVCLWQHWLVEFSVSVNILTTNEVYSIVSIFLYPLESNVFVFVNNHPTCSLNHHHRLQQECGHHEKPYRRSAKNYREASEEVLLNELCPSKEYLTTTGDVVSFVCFSFSRLYRKRGEMENPPTFGPTATMGSPPTGVVSYPTATPEGSSCLP